MALAVSKVVSPLRIEQLDHPTTVSMWLCVVNLLEAEIRGLHFASYSLLASQKLS
jgi:hypothetical protein